MYMYVLYMVQLYTTVHINYLHVHTFIDITWFPLSWIYSKVNTRGHAPVAIGTRVHARVHTINRSASGFHQFTGHTTSKG